MSVPDKLAAKWNARVLDEGFVPFPKRLLRCLNRIFVGPTRLNQLRVVLALVDFRRPDYQERPTAELLAYTAGMPVKKFNAVLSELKKLRLIEVDEDDDRLSIGISGVLKRIVEETDDH